MPFEQIGLDPRTPLQFPNRSKPILIAVIDDGFLIEHESLRGLLWNNPGEIPNNGIDEDLNNQIDDVYGWDISDSDENLRPPEDRLEEFYHGTFSAGLVAAVLRSKLGTLEDYPIKIMLVKAVSDREPVLLVKEGYLGIDYAVENGADVISNSWSGGVLDSAARQILNDARNAGVFVVNSIGNFYSPLPSEPSSHPAVFGVTAVNREGVITDRADYGQEVDIAAVGTQVTSASVQESSGYVTTSGTSVASPLVAATAALMRLVNSTISVGEINACLKNTARPLERENPLIAGKIGAGMLQVDAAIECARNPVEFLKGRFTRVPEGAIGLWGSGEEVSEKWEISPSGEYAGIRFTNSVSGERGNMRMEIRSLVDPDNSLAQDLLWSGILDALPGSISFDAPAVEILLSGNAAKDFVFRSYYQVEAIDFEKRYCSGRQVIDEVTTIMDGSGDQSYAAKSDCQWLVMPKEGKSIHLHFASLDIELNDKIYLFRGEQQLQRDLLVTISGNELPPNMIIKNGAALLWFVSDPENEQSGFSIDVSWIDKTE